MAAEDLKNVESHFDFGENWADFAATVDETAIREAELALQRLVDRSELAGRSFLDVGCGSGLHSLAAARLGVRPLLALDIDQRSVATARELLGRHARDLPWQVDMASVFDLDPETQGRFEIVYSWGVLHHTGDLVGAVERAADMVAPSGLFVLALYRRTPLDWFWIREKRWYAKAGRGAQRLARSAYTILLRLGLILRGQSYASFKQAYKSRRGMTLRTDVHDWLGGFPYEPISPGEVEALMKRLGFERLRHHAGRTRTGLLGSGCDEYVYRRQERDGRPIGS